MKFSFIVFIFFISVKSFAHDFTCKLPSHDLGFESSEELLMADERSDGLEVTALGQFAQSFGAQEYFFSRPFDLQSSNAQEVVYSENTEHDSLGFEIVLPRFKTALFKAKLHFIHQSSGLVSVIHLHCQKN